MTSSRMQLSMVVLGAVLLSLPTLLRRTGKTHEAPGVVKARQEFIDSGNGTLDPGPESSSGLYARYDLFNDGGRSVRVLRVESECGCAAPKVSPLIIEPGRSAVAEVTAVRPPAGDKTVHFTIHTDSPTTPKLVLGLRIVSSRRPPYILRTRGHLSFAGAPRKGDGVEYVVDSIENEEASKPPELTSTLPYVGFTLLNTIRRDFPEASYHEKSYTYRAYLTDDPPDGVYSGEAIVVDPWDRAHKLTSRIDVQKHDGVRVYPSRLILNLRNPSDAEASVRFITMRKFPESRPRVGAADESASPFLVAPDAASSTDSVAAMVVRLKPGAAVEEGEYKLIVSAEGEKETPLPLRVAVGGPR